MNVLITGALGWLGSALTEVIGQHHRVRAFDMESGPVDRQPLKVDAEIVYGNITDFETVQKAVQGQDAVIHSAVANTREGLYNPGEVLPFEVNVRGTYNMLEAARQVQVQRFVHIGAAETHVEYPQGVFLDRQVPYRGLDNVYDLTKCLQEETCRWFNHVYDMDIIIFRLGGIIDAETGVHKLGEARWKYVMDRDGWIDRYDIGKACARALAMDHIGLEIFHLIGAPGAKHKFDTARTEAVLDMTFTTAFDRRPASERIPSEK